MPIGCALYYNMLHAKIALGPQWTTKPPMFILVDIAEQGRVPILFSLQQMKNLSIKLDMRPDRVLILCEALGLHRVQATQASSSHIVIDLATIRKVPSRRLSAYESDVHCFFAGGNEVSLGTCPACAGRHRPHTYMEGCKMVVATQSDGTEKPEPREHGERASPDRVLHDLPKYDG